MVRVRTDKARAHERRELLPPKAPRAFLCRMTEAQCYADLMVHARDLTERHIDLLSSKDVHFRPEVNGIRLNSPYWIVAHLTVSENWLILRGTEGPFTKLSWAKLFNLGTTPPRSDEGPTWEEVRTTFVAIHERAVAHVAGLSKEQLDQAHQALMKLPGGNDVRAVIRHHIRHESGHAGQLAWLCRLQGLPTI